MEVAFYHIISFILAVNLSNDSFVLLLRRPWSTAVVQGYRKAMQSFSVEKSIACMWDYIKSV